MNEQCEWRDLTLNVGLLMLRVFMGLAIARHGYDKIFGGQITMLAGGLTQMGMPAPQLLAWLAALSEFAGGLLIALGLGARVAAFFVFFTMCVAVFKAHASDAWHVKELAFLYGSIAFSFIYTGAGRYSLDSLCCRRSSCKTEQKMSGPL
jgi:putative oxidoreductase